ncbi:malonyl-ACP O-methyltransferase BioC [Paenibacillus harenae]|uniref:malonyl-ACP O-methyltransferase BioC n=1 Tax=Paenibacillus harenae TaxID=306543 RepID=UPI002790EC90|nr:malonyl-ACP O-methyltransferase BioC [Paenibacillus harenae]MDQ0058737.1 malonyl-CoA O-methyltransferase [Paenibacillus harenae]
MAGKKAIQRQFNRSSMTYDSHAGVQRTMADQLMKSLLAYTNKGATNEPNILEIGCGTGALTQMVVNEWPSATVTSLDIASEMIKAAEQRFLSVNHSAGSVNRISDRISFIHADIEQWAADAPSSSYDLIVSNACFQWLSAPRETLGHLRRLLRSGGMLIFATFGPDTFREMHCSFHEAYRAWGMEPQRHGLSFLTPLEWKLALEESGYVSFDYERTIQVEKYASAREFLHSVKAMGANASEAVPLTGLSLRRLFTSMYKEYEEKFSLPGGVAATYDLLIIQAAASC